MAKLLVFKNNPMHLWQYSISVDKIITKQPENTYHQLTIPNAIPHNVAFYSITWDLV